MPMNAARFALVKTWFDAVCDLPADQRVAYLVVQDIDPAIIDDVLLLCSDVGSLTGRLAGPVIDALQADFGAALRSGDVLGAWTLLEEIGRGGMGRVFKARRSDGHFEQTAAIKLLAGVASPAALRYLARERQILASLTHPHVARLVDGGSTVQGQPYLVMDYIDGVPIDRYCSGRALDRNGILTLFAQVCGAVAFAHRNLVVHCDLKPSNILVTDAGHAVLLDFGVSHLLGDAVAALPTDLPASGGGQAPTGAAFTPRYASPEQRRGERVGTTTDLYSLGVLLAELLGAQLHERDAPSPAVTEIRGLEHLPRDLAAIIASATHPEPQRRYPSVEALTHDLGRYRARQPVAARARTRRYVAAMLLRRQWPWFAVSLLFIVTVSAFAWRMRDERNNALNAERAALAVKDYMVSVFQGADPEVSGQRDLPVSTLLDAGRDKLAIDLRDQPAVRAEIGGILGSVYQNIGQREQALKMFDEAIAVERRQHRPLVLARLIYKKAYTLYDIEDFARAEPVAADALARIEALVPGTVEHAESLRLVGSILNYEGKTDAAAAYLQRALATAGQAAGADSIASARVHVDLARLHIFNEPSPKAAIPHARNALDTIGRLGGKGHYLYADALEITALALGNNQQLDEALPLARESADLRIARYGEISNQAGFSLYTYARLLSRAGARREAIVILERCVHIQDQLDGGNTLAGEVPITMLAQVLEQAGALPAAWARLRQSRDIRMRLMPAGERTLLDLDFLFGRILRLQGRLDEAEQISAAVLQQRLADAGTHPFRLMQSQLEVAALFREQGRLDEAEALIRRIDPTSFVDEPWRQGFLDLERARIAARRGGHGDAIAQSLRAEAMLANGLGADHPDVWLNRIDRAEWLAAAQPLAAKALAQEIARHVDASIAKDGYWASRLAALTVRRAP